MGGIYFEQVRWPVSLVLSRRALTKYQLIFRHLFHCKHVKRQLCAAWQIHQVHFVFRTSFVLQKPKFQYLLDCICYKHNTKHHLRESFASWSSIWHCLPFLKKHFYTLQLATRPFDVMGTAVSQSYAVCQRMLHYVQSFEHYMTFEVFFLSVLFSTSILSSVFI